MPAKKCIQFKHLYILPLFLILFSATGAEAHFGMLIPSENMVSPEGKRAVDLQASFSHPAEMVGMDLVLPAKFEVVGPQGKTDIKGSLKENQVMGKKAWMAEFTFSRPGAYAFCMEPQPYWEPAEELLIVHYTKTVVAAFGDDSGWDQEIGLLTEIVPLTRPFGLYAGNLFQGMVKLKGKPVADAMVEVEFYNADGKAKPGNDLMITQALKTDPNGIFSYAVPWAGWWGFSALSEADYKLPCEGKDRDVELGAVIWVKFEERLIP